jgi:2-oxo-3-hexenedioate decarboxylase
MTGVDIGKWAGELFEAEQRRQATPPITDTEPDLSLEDAYAIQAEFVARKVAAGERVIGAKLGLTSRAKQRAVGVDEPIYAWLTDAMVQPADLPVSLGELIHPRVEPEIVFIMAEELAGPGVTAQDVLSATAAVCAGVEVIDSRYVDFRFTLPDVVADNASSARFILGPSQVRADFDLSLTGCVVQDGAEVVETATGAAVMGHPANAVALLANALGRRGQRIEPGWPVLSGGLTAPVRLRPGASVTVSFARLGSIAVRAVA